MHENLKRHVLTPVVARYAMTSILRTLVLASVALMAAASGKLHVGAPAAGGLDVTRFISKLWGSVMVVICSNWPCSNGRYVVMEVMT